MQVCPNSWHFCKDGIHVQTAIASLPFPLCQHVSSVPQSSRHIVHALLSCAEIPAADDVPSPTAQQTRRTMFWHRPHAIHCIWSPFSPHLPQLHPLPLCLQPLSTGFYVTLGWVTAWSTHSQQCMCWLGALKSPCTSLLMHNNSLPESLPELMPQMQIILDTPLGSQIVKQRRMAKTGLCKLTLPVAACTVTGTLTLSC